MRYHPQPARQAGESLTRPGPQAILYFGGNAEDVSATLPQLARLFPDHALYLMHHRDFGQSQGEPSEPALLADAKALCDHVQHGHTHITPYDSIETWRLSSFPGCPYAG